MKTKSWILFILAIVFAVNAHAVKKPQLNVVALENSKALVAVEQTGPEKSILSIESEDGNIVYYKETKKQASEFKTIFDLSNLDEGEYAVKVKSGTVLVKRDIHIGKNSIKIEQMQTVYDPVFAMKDNALRVSYLNFDKKDMRFQVYQDGALIFDKNIGNDFDLQKIFDFSWMKRGNYDIALASSGTEYWYSLKR